MSDTSAERKPDWRRYLPWGALLVFAFFAAWILNEHITFEALQTHREDLLAFRQAHVLAAVGLYLLLYVLMVALSLPGAIFVTLAGGFLFGLWWGTFWTILGATIGATVLFMIARIGLGNALAAKMNASQGTIGRIKAGIDANQWSMLFLIRLVPVVPFFVANLIPAFMNVPLHRYVISTFFGIAPGTFVFASIGAGLGKVFERGEAPDLDVIFEPHVLVPLLGLAALSLLPVVLKSVTGRKGI